MKKGKKIKKQHKHNKRETKENMQSVHLVQNKNQHLNYLMMVACQQMKNFVIVVLRMLMLQ